MDRAVVQQSTYDDRSCSSRAVGKIPAFQIVLFQDLTVDVRIEGRDRAILQTLGDNSAGKLLRHERKMLPGRFSYPSLRLK